MHLSKWTYLNNRWAEFLKETEKEFKLSATICINFTILFLNAPMRALNFTFGSIFKFKLRYIIFSCYHCFF